MKQLLGLATVFTLVLCSSALFAANNGMSDATMTRDVQSKITSGTNVPTVAAPNVVVFSKDGKVKIRGFVDTETQEKDIKKMIKNMEGVKDVDMDVEVIND